MTIVKPGSRHHALIINSVGVYDLDGNTITRGPVTSVAKFQTLLDWLRTKEMLVPMAVTPQIWIAGFVACDVLGWNLDYDDPAVLDALANTADHVEMAAVGKKMLTQRIVTTLADGFDNFGTGWRLRVPADIPLDEVATGPLIPLQYNDGGNRPFRVDVFIEPYMWTLSVKPQLGILGSEGGPSALPVAEAELTTELARRIRWSITSLGTLPALTGAGIGANMVDSIFRPRRKAAEKLSDSSRSAQKSPAFVTDPTPLPTLVGDDLEARFLCCGHADRPRTRSRTQPLQSSSTSVRHTSRLPELSASGGATRHTSPAPHWTRCCAATRCRSRSGTSRSPHRPRSMPTRACPW
ncbi:hypothetical protein [Rhodococcus sp. BS-15]|uniref:hypothetical protein n=1 Tax=Rhodococcus sp. BS-15 TaxID=1304954 RepID=UPI000A7860A7|nr:hypothetical protein [Rhodococcus sp. BS-15]